MIPLLSAGIRPGTGSAVLTLVPPTFVFLLAAFAASVLSRRAGHALAVLSGLAVAAWLFAVPAGTHLPVQFAGFDTILFNVDPLSRVLGIAYGVITALTALYAYGSDRESSQVALMLAYAGTALGVVFAGDWLTLVVFWEVMSVVSAVILWSNGGSAVRAGFRYAVFHAIGGVFLLGAVALYYVSAGTFLFSAVTGIGTGLPAVLAAVGIGVNAGFVAVHTWIPDAYPKPHFVTSVVLCGYTTKTAVYALYRAFPEGSLFVAYLGVAMTLFGVTYALVQTNMRRLLSYHIQSQVGYMVVGIGIGTTVGVAGGFAHLINNILYKSLLFMVAGVIIYRTGREDLKKLGGLARSMPVTAIAFVVAALAITGVPGFSGFVSKELVKTAAKKEQLTTIKWLLTLAGVGTTMSFVKFGYYAFLHGESDGDVRDATAGQTVAMLAVAALCVLLGIYPTVLLGLLPGAPYVTADPYTLGKVLDALLYVVIGGVGFFLIRTQLARIRNIPDIDSIYIPAAFYGLRTVVNGIDRLASRFKGIVHRLARRVGAVATASDPLSTVTRGRFQLPPAAGLDWSVLLLAVLTVVLLVILLV